MVTDATAVMQNGTRTCRRMFEPRQPGKRSIRGRQQRYAAVAKRWWRQARTNLRLANMVRRELVRQASWTANPPESVERMQLQAAESKLEKLRAENAELIEQLATRKGGL